jgi:hypothetical protein
MVRADDAVVNNARLASERPATAERCTTVGTGIAQHMGLALIVTEGDEIAAEHLHLLGLTGTEVFTANDWIPEIYIHAIYSLLGILSKT